MEFSEYGWKDQQEYEKASEVLIDRLNTVLKEDVDKGMSLVEKADALEPSKENVYKLIEETEYE